MADQDGCFEDSPYFKFSFNKDFEQSKEMGIDGHSKLCITYYSILFSWKYNAL